MKRLLSGLLLAGLCMVAHWLPITSATLPTAQAVALAGCVRTGTIQVTNTDTSTVIGFVSKLWNSFGEYVVTTTPSDYLSVSVTAGATLPITALNPQNNSFPLVGGIVGFASTSDNLGTGSFNYAYLGGTTTTAPNAAAVSGPNAFTNATSIPEDIESAIWTDPNNDVLTAQWVNTDLSKPATHLVITQNILVMTGDTALFGATFGPFSNVALTLVSPSGPCALAVTACTAAPAVLTPADGTLRAVNVTLGVSGSSAVTVTLLSLSSADPITAADHPGFTVGNTYAVTPPATSVASGQLRAAVSPSAHGRIYQLVFGVAGGNPGASCQVSVQVRLH